MPANTQLKPMKLIFSKGEGTWDKIITDLEGNVIFEQRGLILFEENNNKEYFDNWESQLKGLPVWNIVEVERFI
jgi:hypothetical protein